MYQKRIRVRRPEWDETHWNRNEWAEFRRQQALEEIIEKGRSNSSDLSFKLLAFVAGAAIWLFMLMLVARLEGWI